jgi:hypothetical protein
MAYYATGRVVYSTANNKNTAFTQMTNVLNNFPNIVGVDSVYPAGLNSESTTVVTFSLEVPDADVDAFRSQFAAAWSSAVSSRTQTGVAKI